MISLAGYSVVAYIIKLHDRHNGNILVDTGKFCAEQGHYSYSDWFN